MDKYCEYHGDDERHRRIKLIISIKKDLYDMIKDCVEHGQNYDYFEVIANGIPYDERPQGKWIGIAGEYRCDKCYGKLWYRSDYCPKCGVRMIKETENEDSN